MPNGVEVEAFAWPGSPASPVLARGCPRSRAFRDLGFQGRVHLGILPAAQLPRCQFVQSRQRIRIPAH